MRTSADIRADIAAFDAEHNVGADFYQRPDRKAEQRRRDELCGELTTALQSEDEITIDLLP